jgi:hypothetical protein
MVARVYGGHQLTVDWNQMSISLFADFGEAVSARLVDTLSNSLGSMGQEASAYEFLVSRKVVPAARGWLSDETENRTLLIPS